MLLGTGSASAASTAPFHNQQHTVTHSHSDPQANVLSFAERVWVPIAHSRHNLTFGAFIVWLRVGGGPPSSGPSHRQATHHNRKLPDFKLCNGVVLDAGVVVDSSMLAVEGN